MRSATTCCGSAFATKEIKAALKPLLSLETFGAGPRSRAVRVDAK